MLDPKGTNKTQLLQRQETGWAQAWPNRKPVMAAAFYRPVIVGWFSLVSVLLPRLMAELGR